MKSIHPFRGVRPHQRHSLVLIVAGLFYIALGWVYISEPSTPARRVALQIALDWMSFDGWGAVFIFAGILSIISSRWPPISETWGYTVLTGLSAGWAAFYFAGVIFGNAPDSNVSGGLIWALVAFLWWAISGLRNPNEPR